MSKPIRVSEDAHELALIKAGEESVREGRVVPVSEVVTKLIIKSWTTEDEPAAPKGSNGEKSN